MNEADCEQRALCREKRLNIVFREGSSVDPFNASNQERTINEKGIRKNSKCKKVYYNGKPLAKSSGRSPRNGACLW